MTTDNCPIDLTVRPQSYLITENLAAQLLVRIKGTERKKTVKKYMDEGRLDELPAYLAASSLSETEREMIGRIHPAFMGGEYLPDMEDSEIEICRIVLESTTSDVICVYARVGQKRIHYRIVDEYGGDTLNKPTTRTSVRPLTLGALTKFIDGSWSLLDNLSMNFGNDLVGALGFFLCGIGVLSANK